MVRLGQTYAENERHLGSLQEKARSRSSRGGDGDAAFRAAAAMGSFSLNNTTQSRRQFSAFRGIPYTAVRPIAVRIAGQPIQAGASRVQTVGPDNQLLTKRHSLGGFYSSAELQSLNLRNKEFKDRAPDFIQKMIGEGVDVLESHPLVSRLQFPNSYMVGWSLMYCTVVSLQVSGRAFWLLDDDGKIYYIPPHWIQPVPGKEFELWNIEHIDNPVRDEQVVFFPYPDPENPTGSFSPLQAQAKAINTDDKLQDAQHAALENGIHPSVILRAGRMPGPTGQLNGPRPILTKEQRRQLLTAIRMMYRGVHNRHEPIIVDGLIEDVLPYSRSPAEMDFMGGSQLTKDRIMQGIGTSPVVAGHSENANRAGSYVAHEVFYDIVVNPLINLISQVMTAKMVPYFGAELGNLYFWIERAAAFDADLQMRRAHLARPAMTRGEVRQYAMTGKLSLSPREDDNDLLQSGATTRGAGATSV